MSSSKYLKLLACEVLTREIGWLAAQSPHTIDLEFLPVGHHDDPKSGRADLQQRIARLPAGQYDAVLVGYGLCNLMLTGLKAGEAPLIVPRAHDCITLFLGSRQRYQQVFQTCPGTYYFTAGWLEFPFRKARAQGVQASAEEVGAQTSPFALSQTYQELVAKYGEDNAQYLVETTQRWTQSYQRGLLIRFDFDRHLGSRERVQDLCHRHGWQYEEMSGDLGLLQRWLNGPWDTSEFLVVQPGQSICPTYNDAVIEASPASEPKTAAAR